MPLRAHYQRPAPPAVRHVEWDMIQGLGRTIVILALIALGACIIMQVLGRLGLRASSASARPERVEGRKLPGDFAITGKGWRIYIPIGTSILFSIILTAILFILSWLRRL